MASADLDLNAQVGIQNGVLVQESSRESELIADGSSARRDITAGRHMDLVKHIVVEVVNIRPDSRFLVGIDGKGDDKGFRRLGSSADQICFACSSWSTKAYTSVVLADGSRVISGASMWLDACAAGGDAIASETAAVSVMILIFIFLSLPCFCLRVKLSLIALLALEIASVAAGPADGAPSGASREADVAASC